MSLANLTPNRYPAAWRWLIERVWRIEHAFERSRAAGKAEDDTRLRILFILAVFGVLFSVTMVGATIAAAFSDARLKALGPGLPEQARGDLVDRDGRLLAVNLLAYSLYLDPDEVWSKTETRTALLTTVPGLTAKRLDKVLNGERRGLLIEGLTAPQRAAIHALGLPGVSFEEQTRRAYPLGNQASHVLGFVDKGGEGLSGVERALNDEIKASAASGKPVQLSIDLRVQNALEEEIATAAAKFQPKGAVGLVTDIQTGEIIAMASWPDFDANRAGQSSDEARLNRAAASVYEMGSTFKAFTVAIGLDSGVANIDSTFDARTPLKMGYRTIHDFHGTGRILTLSEVFNHSSNIGTARLAISIGLDRMGKYFDAFGLTRPAKVELLESARPLTPKKWNEDALASTSFGHGIDISPLALAQAMGAILNGGRMVPMTIRKAQPGVLPEGPRVVSEQTTLAMLQIMRGNVVGGTGRSANAPGLRVGGKTGTGEKYDPEIKGYSHTKQVASFAAVFPTDGPVTTKRYFVLVLMDEPQGPSRTGGIVSAPVVGKVIDRTAGFLGVQRKQDDPVMTPSTASAGAADPETAL